jgi:hypothetical protein
MDNHNADKPTTVKELFTPLGERLFEFESGRYHDDVGHYIMEWDEISYNSHSEIFDNIGKLANYFNPAEVYEEAQHYIARVKAVFEILEPPAFEKVEYDQLEGWDKIVSKPPTEERKQELMEGYKLELNSYLKDLDALMKARKGYFSSKPEAAENNPKLQNMQQTVIQLPENFTVTQLNKHFDPQLSVNQAALFLYYLREQAVLPPYSDSSIGVLAEAFFVRNKKGITQGLTDIYSIKESKEDLNGLKRVLQALIKQIDADLKEAR